MIRQLSKFVGAGASLKGTPRAIGQAARPSAVKVMGPMPPGARRVLGSFYQPHNAQLVRLLTNSPKATYSPSLKSLEIQGWCS